jgi:hypothetical protein
MMMTWRKAVVITPPVTVVILQKITITAMRNENINKLGSQYGDDGIDVEEELDGNNRDENDDLDNDDEDEDEDSDDDDDDENDEESDDDDDFSKYKGNGDGNGNDDANGDDEDEDEDSISGSSANLDHLPIHPLGLVAGNSIECRFVKKFLKGLKPVPTVASAELVSSAQTALFNYLKKRSRQKPAKGKPCVPPPSLLTCQISCSKELCDKLLLSIGGAGKTRGRPASEGVARYSTNNRQKRLQTAKKTAQSEAMAKAKAHNAVNEEEKRRTKDLVDASLAAGEQSLNATRSFLLPFGENYPSSIFGETAGVHFYELGTQIAALSKLAYNSQACLHLIVELEDAQVILAKRFAGVTPWAREHLSSIVTNATSIAERKRARELALKDALEQAASLKKTARRKKSVDELKEIGQVKRFWIIYNFKNVAD